MSKKHVSNFKDKTNRKKFSLKVEQEMLKKARGGDEAAISRIVEAYTWLVNEIAKDFQNKDFHFKDLVPFGISGLKGAIARSDAPAVTNFSRCALWWVRQAILSPIRKKNGTIFY